MMTMMMTTTMMMITMMIPAAVLGQVPAAELRTMMVNGGWPCTALRTKKPDFKACECDMPT